VKQGDGEQVSDLEVERDATGDDNSSISSAEIHVNSDSSKGNSRKRSSVAQAPVNSYSSKGNNRKRKFSEREIKIKQIDKTQDSSTTDEEL
jgi:hypothetical protein